MTSLVQLFRSSLGRKYLMGLTGLGLAVFTLTHMAGNLALFIGADAYNIYAYTLTKNKAFLYAAEGGLLACFGLHIYCALSLWWQNGAARKAGYAALPHGDKGVSLASQSMVATGSLVLLFVLVHLYHFKFGAHYDTTVSGTEMRDLYKLVAGDFGKPSSPWLWFYIAALVVLCNHLRHGVSSAFQSLGFVGPKYRCMVARAGTAYALLVCVGFALPPLYLAFAR